MKTAFDILHDFKGASLTAPEGSFFTCVVSIQGRYICTGMGPTKEKAEETAYYGTKITLDETK